MKNKLIEFEDCITEDVIDVIAEKKGKDKISYLDCMEIFDKGNQIFFNLYDRSEDNYYDACLLAQTANGYCITETIFYPKHLYDKIVESSNLFPELEKMTNGSYERLIEFISTLSEDDAQVLEIVLRMMWNAEAWGHYYPNAQIRKAALELGDVIISLKK